MDDIKIRVIDSKKLIEAINSGSYDINLSAVMALGAVVTQSAETENIEEFKKNLLRTINAGIVATNTKDDYSCGMRNGMRWCRALLDNKEPQYEHTPAQPQDGFRFLNCGKVEDQTNDKGEGTT